MRKKNTYLSLIVLILSFFSCKNDNVENLSTEKNLPTISELPKFTLLPPYESKITFANTLTEGPNTNVMMYEYFYNGAGVATGDFNGDDLIDIYFTSNMGENKLYLNQGNLQFKDVTFSSGAAGRNGPWKTGVTIVDINGDNLLDIYICYSGALPDEKRANQLFVNQGNGNNNTPTFIDEAAKYGLDSKGYSNQGYFLDYDRDGDLDMLLLNHNPKSLPVLNEVSTAKKMAEDDLLQGVRLYRQDNGFFKDVTKRSGINGSSLTYGLGIGIADLNQDGWVDFYVSNDYTIPDYLYVNNKNGTFSNQLKEQIRCNSHFSMGNDVADLNNDGLQDIITLDMLPEDNQRQKLLVAPDNYSKFDLNVRSGFHYQYMRNMLQLNNGNGTFSEIGQLAGISNTDWSWAALAADYDNDGWKDLYITNGYTRDYTNLDFINYMNDFVQEKGRLKRENVLELIQNMPASDVVNYMFSNQPSPAGGNNFTFQNKTKEWGLHHASNSNGAAYADFDNDGDLDLVVNNINKPAFLFRNETKSNEFHFLKIKLEGDKLNTLGIGAKVQLFYEGKIQTVEQQPTRGYLSSVSPILHFGLGKNNTIDSVIVIWQNGKMEEQSNVSADQVLTFQEKNATSKFSTPRKLKPIFTKNTSPINYKNPKQSTLDFDRQLLLLSELSHQGPCMTKGDLNGDGLDDVFIGGSKSQSASVFLQQKNNQFQRKENNAFAKDKASEDTDAEIFDANGDGYLDIYVASGGYHNFKINDPALQDRLYLNDGKGNFSKSENALPKSFESNSTIAIHDLNSDGHLDVFVGARVVVGRHPESPVNTLLLNDGQGNFSNQIKTIAPELENLGMVTDAEWIDLNGDGAKDLVAVGEWLPVSAFIFKEGKLENKTAVIFGKKYKGWWNTIAVGDFNQDQKPDLLIGNIGTNTQFKVSENEPAELIYKDFDKNGSVDPIFNFYISGKKYPYLTRDELLKQLSSFRPRFNTYESFSAAGIEDVFKKEELQGAKKWVANEMETSLFLSSSDGEYKKQNLPIQVQYAPINAISILDFNKDGNVDVLLCGNNSHMKLRMGRMDSNYGVLLQGNGQGDFKYINQSKSGLNIQGDVKDVLQFGNTLLFGINQAEMVSYKLN